jgi:hypothetical protein
LPAHLLLTLDARDPLLASLKLGPTRYFRLVHPFHYSQGEAFAYRQSKGSIEFIQPSRFGAYIDWPEGSIDWPDYCGPYPAHFTTISATLENHHLLFDEKLENQIVLGADQEELRQQTCNCICPVCSEPTRLIARIPDQIEAAPETLWGGNCIDTLFWYCDRCQIVVTHNECS